MTQCLSGERWLYVAVSIDAFSERVIGWAMGEWAVADLKIDAVNRAIWNRRPDAGVIHHSGHGSHNTSISSGLTPREVGMGSLGVGEAYGTTVAESYYVTRVVEFLSRSSWAIRKRLRTASFDYIEVCYNHWRHRSTMRQVKPFEFVRMWEMTQ